MRRGGRFDMGAGRYSRQPPASAPTDLITNPGFIEAGDPWIALDLGGGTGVGAGLGSLNDPDDNGENISQVLAEGGAGTYHLTYTIASRGGGSMKPVVNGVSGVSRDTTGAKSEDIVVAVPSGSPLITFQTGDTGLPNVINFTDVHLYKTA